MAEIYYGGSVKESRCIIKEKSTGGFTAKAIVTTACAQKVSKPLDRRCPWKLGDLLAFRILHEN